MPSKRCTLAWRNASASIVLKLLDGSSWSEWKAKAASKTGQRFPKHCLCLVMEGEKSSAQWKDVQGGFQNPGSTVQKTTGLEQAAKSSEIYKHFGAQTLENLNENKSLSL